MTITDCPLDAHLPKWVMTETDGDTGEVLRVSDSFTIHRYRNPNILIPLLIDMICRLAV